MKRRNSRVGKSRGTASGATKDARQMRDLARARMMVWAALFTGLLISGFTAYGMVSGDRELLSEVWSLIRIVTVALVAWGGGKGLLEVLSRLRFEDDRAEPPES